jgi:hypothetical protein
LLLSYPRNLVFQLLCRSDIDSLSLHGNLSHLGVH